LRCISAVFCQTKRESGVFSTGTEKNGFAGFSGIALKTGWGNGALFGRFRDSGVVLSPDLGESALRLSMFLGDDQRTGHQMTVTGGSLTQIQKMAPKDNRGLIWAYSIFRQVPVTGLNGALLITFFQIIDIRT